MWFSGNVTGVRNEPPCLRLYRRGDNSPRYLLLFIMGGMIMDKPTLLDISRANIKRFIEVWEKMKGDKPDPFIDKQIAELKKLLAK